MIGDLFNFILLAPMINLLVFIVRTLESFSIPGALGLSIILITVLIKAVTWPFASSQIRHSKHLATKMAELKPHLEVLKEKHKDDKMAYAQAQGDLYKQHGINPAAGCLPAIVPLLAFFPLYQTVDAFLVGAHGLERINYFLYNSAWRLTELPSSFFLGLNLADRPSDFAKVGFLIVLVPLIAGLTQFILAKMMQPKVAKVTPKDTELEKVQKETTEETMQQVQSQMVYTMPLVFGFISFTFPVGLSLYIITLNLLSIAQQYLVARSRTPEISPPAVKVERLAPVRAVRTVAKKATKRTTKKTRK